MPLFYKLLGVGCLVFLLGFLAVREAAAQDERETDPRPGVDLTVRGVGMGFGHVPVVHGLRFNYRDYEFQRVTGLNLTIWRAFEDLPQGTVNGLALGMPATVAGRIRGVGIGLLSIEATGPSWGVLASMVSATDGGGGIALGGFGLALGGQYTGLSVGGLGVGGGALRGITVGGLGAGASDRIAGLAVGGMGIGSGGTATGIVVGGLGAGVSDSMRGILIGGLGAGIGGTAYGLSIGGLGVGGNRLHGLQVGGLGVGAGERLWGLQLGGLGVGSERVAGITAALLGVGASERLRGVQVAGVGLGAARVEGVSGALAVGGRSITGLTLAPAYLRIEDGTARGFSVSGWHDIRGHQQGLAIGLYNYARNLSGVQIGVLNYARNNPIPFRVLPLVNVNL